MGSLASLFPDQEDVSDCSTSPNSTSPALQDPDDPRDETLRRYSYGVAMPAICCLGVLGNILNLVVLTRRNMKGIAYVYMRGKYLCASYCVVAWCVCREAAFACARFQIVTAVLVMIRVVCDVGGCVVTYVSKDRGAFVLRGEPGWGLVYRGL